MPLIWTTDGAFTISNGSGIAWGSGGSVYLGAGGTTQKQVTDSISVSTSETAAIRNEFTLADSISVSTSEALSITVDLTVADGINVSINDALSIGNSLTVTDTGTVECSEALSIAVTLTVEDSITVSIEDAISDEISTEPFFINVSDSIEVSSSEAISLVVGVTVPDSINVSATDSLSLTASIPVADSLTVLQEELLSFSFTLSVTDTVEIDIDDEVDSSITKYIISVADAIAVSTTEVIDVASTTLELVFAGVFIPRYNPNRWLPISTSPDTEYNMKTVVTRLNKQPSESRIYGIDFSNYDEIAKQAESLISVASVTANPGTLTIEDIDLIDEDEDGIVETVAFRVLGGVKDVQYKVTAIVNTNGDNVLEGQGILSLEDN
jgi:hypothetical protein